MREWNPALYTLPKAGISKKKSYEMTGYFTTLVSWIALIEYGLRVRVIKFRFFSFVDIRVYEFIGDYVADRALIYREVD